MKFLAAPCRTTRTCERGPLQRTADNKYMRLSADDPDDELVGGFPKTREELFKYRGLIIGRVEAGALHRRSAADDCATLSTAAAAACSSSAGRARLERAATAALRLPTRCHC